MAKRHAKIMTRWERIEIRLRSAAVHIGYLWFGRGRTSWQAYYNASCFDALLLEHCKNLRKNLRKEELEDRVAAGREPKVQDRARRLLGREQKVHDRALRLLDMAFKEADDQLSPGWVARDPDQKVFRGSRDPDQKVFGDMHDPEWWRLVNRVPIPHKSVQKLPKRKLDPVRFPPRPWGDPERRAWWWTGVAVAAGALFVFALVLTFGFEYVLIASIVFAVAVWRLGIAGFERWRDYGNRRLKTPDTASSKPELSA
jgi:hypothetical protein